MLKFGTRIGSALAALLLVTCASLASAATQHLPAGYRMVVTATGSSGTLERLANEPAAPTLSATTTVSVGTPVARGPYGVPTRWRLSDTLSYVMAPANPVATEAADGTVTLAPADSAAEAMIVGGDAVTQITFLTDGGDVVYDGTLDGVAPAGIIADASAGTWDFTKTAAGTAVITSSDDNSTAALTVDPGGNALLTLGATGDTCSVIPVTTFTEVPVFPAGGATFGSTTISEAEAGVLDSLAATKVEIQNECDISAQLQAITSAGAVTVDGTKRRATLSGGAYAITLAAPGAAAIGAVLVIEYTGGDTDAVTLALTNVIGESGGTTATFNADGEGIAFIGTALGWVVLKEFGGVTLA